MAFSQIGIINLALSFLGPKRISSLTEDSEQSLSAVAAWEYCVKQALESRDWVFAKERVALAQNATDPVVKYTYAYTLPSDFLRIVKERDDDPAVYAAGAYSSSYQSGVLEVQGKTYGYVIENISDDTLCLFSDYDNTDNDLYITYIKYETDESKFSAHFCFALAALLGAVMSINLTESDTKYNSLTKLYEKTLKDATGFNQSLDFHNDIGSDDWETAGR